MQLVVCICCPSELPVEAKLALEVVLVVFEPQVYHTVHFLPECCFLLGVLDLLPGPVSLCSLKLELVQPSKFGDYVLGRNPLWLRISLCRDVSREVDEPAHLCHLSWSQ